MLPCKAVNSSKVGIRVGTGIALILMICIFFVAKNPREIKFLMYYYLKVDTVPKDDRDENVDNMEYDTFFCYRYMCSFRLYLNLVRFLELSSFLATKT